jgi:hypothetical protein
VNEDNLSGVRWEATRHFRKKKREYLKDEINELESDSKNRTSEACIGAKMNLRRTTNLELI